MNSQNPLDSQLADTIKLLITKIESLERSRQSYQGDWYEYNPVNYAFKIGGIGVIEIFNTPVLPFAIGDKVKLKQAGLTKFFYITNVAPGLIVVTAGDDYTLTNNPITYFAVSRLSTPEGHPISFSRNITGLTIDGAFLVSSALQTFYMIGSSVFLYTDLQITATGVDNTIQVPLPATRRYSWNFVSTTETFIAKDGAGPSNLYPSSATVRVFDPFDAKLYISNMTNTIYPFTSLFFTFSISYTLLPEY